MSTHPPVTDWATDFDHTDPGWVNDPFPIWDELREKCPVAHSDRYGGVWLPVTHEGVAAVAYDTDHFTSRSVIERWRSPTMRDRSTTRFRATRSGSGFPTPNGPTRSISST